MLFLHIASFLWYFGAGQSLRVTYLPFNRFCLSVRAPSVKRSIRMQRTHALTKMSLDGSSNDSGMPGFGSRSRRRSQGLARKRHTGVPEDGGKQAVSILKRSNRWACVKNCGACCYLAHSERSNLEEYLADREEMALYKSITGPDGWCKHYDKERRACRIYDERPRFCRVEIETFEEMYGLEPEDMDDFCSSCCKELITHVYGGVSVEMKAFESALAVLARGERPTPDANPFGDSSLGGQTGDTDGRIRDWGIEISSEDTSGDAGGLSVCDL